MIKKSLIALFPIILLGIWYLHTLNLDPKIEDTVSYIADSYKNIPHELHGITREGLCYTILGKKITFATPEQNPIASVEMPFTSSDIFQIIISEDYLLIITGNLDLPHKRKYYRLDLANYTITALTTNPYVIYECDTFYDDPNKVYIKFLLPNNPTPQEDSISCKQYYGYLDITSGKCTPIFSIDDKNIFDILIAGKTIFHVSLTGENYQVSTASGKHLFSQPVSYSQNVSTQRNFQSPIFYRTAPDGTVYYMNPTIGPHGTIFRYDPEKEVSQPVPLKLQGDLTGFSILKTEGMLLDYEDDNSYSYVGTHESETKIRIYLENHPNTNIILLSKDYTKMMAQQFATNTCYYEKYIDLTTGSEKILREVHTPVEYTKKSNTIYDSNKQPLQFYSITHNDSLKHPVVFCIHGGPFSQYSINTTDPNEEALYLLGYNIIELNFHGSRGLGLDYQKAAGTNLPQACLHNIETLLDWIEKSPQYDPDNVVLYGSSWGGYATIYGKMKLGSRIKAAIASVPASLGELTPNVSSMFDEVRKNPDAYDILQQLKSTKEDIAIFYDPNDPQIHSNPNWAAVALDNKHVEILKTTHYGHSTNVTDFKYALYYLKKRIPFQEEWENKYMK